MFESLGKSIGKSLQKTSQRTMLNAEILMCDREIKSRQAQFGVTLYDYCDSSWSKQQSFFASDDTLTATVRPHMLTAQREIAALDIKYRKRKEGLSQAEVQRGAAIAGATSSTNWMDTIKGAARATAVMGSEAKLMTEKKLIEQEILTYKQRFGAAVFEKFVELEDSENWLPTDREIRSQYDACRADIDKIKKRKAEKEEQLKELDGGGSFKPTEPAPVPPPVDTRGMYPQASSGLNTAPYPNTSTGQLNTAPYPSASSSQLNTAPYPNAHGSPTVAASASTPTFASPPTNGYGATSNTPQQQQTPPTINPPTTTQAPPGAADPFGLYAVSSGAGTMQQQSSGFPKSQRLSNQQQQRQPSWAQNPSSQPSASWNTTPQNNPMQSSWDAPSSWSPQRPAQSPASSWQQQSQPPASAAGWPTTQQQQKPVDPFANQTMQPQQPDPFLSRGSQQQTFPSAFSQQPSSQQNYDPFAGL